MMLSMRIFSSRVRTTKHTIPKYLNFGHYEYDQTLQCFFDMMTHVITDPGIKRLLTFQLKRLGISHVESETYAGKLIFSALNNSNK